MIPRTYPTSLHSSTGRRQMVVYFLSSVTGLTRWVDYIPVQWGTANTPRENSTDTGGYLSVDSLSSTTGKQAWVDYIPVYLDASATGNWTIDSVGFLPIGLSGVGGMPIGLFAAGEQGVWYDPSDMSTMYQDSAGSTPVTAVGQPVGLILDKRLGAVRGAEQITNDASWILTQPTSGSTTRLSPGVYRIVSTDGTYAAVTYPGASAGQWYEITLEVTAVASGSITAGFSGTAGPTATTTGVKRFIVQATSAGNFEIKRTGVCDVTFQNVSYKPLPGNHATQATAASRPTLSGRYNLLTKSEDFSDASWQVFGGAAKVGASPVAAPNGSTAYEVSFGSTGGASASALYQNVTLSTVGYQAGFYVRAKSGSTTVRVAGFGAGSPVFSADTTVTDSAWTWITVPFTYGSGAANISLRNNVAGTSANVYVAQADCRLSADASLAIPSYQRVNTATDYDTTGFPLYLSFDGVDDSLATGSIDFSATDKMTVFAGVYKASDAAAGMVCELGANTGLAANTGTFAMSVSPTNGTDRLSFGAELRGTGGGVDGAQATRQARTYTAPVSAVLSSQSDISQATVATEITLRVNGSSAGITDLGSSAGTGNFGNYPLYIGRRGGSTLPFNGRLYSLVVRGAATDATQVSATERYVASKSGISL